MLVLFIYKSRSISKLLVVYLAGDAQHDWIGRRSYDESRNQLQFY